MAVVENAAASVNNPESYSPQNGIDQSKSYTHLTNGGAANPINSRSNDQSLDQQNRTPTPPPPQMNDHHHHQNKVVPMGLLLQHHQQQMMNGHHGDDGGEGFKREMRDLEEMLSKLNPMAEEFVPPSLATPRLLFPPAGPFGYPANNFVMHTNATPLANGNSTRRKKNNVSQGKRRMNTRTSMAQRDDVIRRTVYVSDIDHQVTEEQLAALFINCGQVVDCRVCGDPNSVLRFAFIEFTDEEGAANALSLAGTMLGYYPVRVLPSKTAIAPVNPTFLPRSEDEREMCARTIYCTNIDKKVTQADVKLFFESICGEVHRLRLLGDYQHSTRIAFVEFVMAESAIAALNCSGVVLGSLPIRVSPSKTPVRPRAPRPSMH